ncbi:Molybdate-binding periplasmic protein precursor [Candidatus Brocadiaceae bacterium B188]|nr:molybdate ABC transporter substrate-binding protein [Candidatus Brocadia sapporoensis]QQR66028.1 MAG: molybdate ABC transporter substrate-binding protein [Candidatus Brocadia sp.]RZV57634.1 MAG: molybdate ABC transporter substrate-binding protein [Candidatus Brocadia sp. BROELEC01]TWU52936.1 Molybdate-binding periplasmic protein precursor [Candidatus Brocadiaceae bacterium B188]
MMNLKRSKGLATKFVPLACVAWLLFLLMAFHNPVLAEEKILIAAAANLNPAMNDIIKGFKKEYPAIDAVVSYGSSGNFFAQIKQGAPFDIFFSADTTYPARLEDEGLAVKGESKIYAFGSIVLWIPRSSSLNPRKGLHLVSDNKVKKLAIANQKLAPYGVAAEEALRYYGLWDKVQDKLVFGENISQTAQFVQSGAADVGIIALSQAISPKLENDGDYWIIPAESYNKLGQAYTILQKGKDKPGVRKFLEFVQGKKGEKVFLKYGYSLPK